MPRIPPNEARREWGSTRDAILKNIDAKGYNIRAWSTLAQELGVKPAYVRKRVLEFRKKGLIPTHPSKQPILEAKFAEPQTMLELIEQQEELTPDQIKKGLSYIALNSDHKDSQAALDKLNRILSGADRGIGPAAHKNLDEEVEAAALVVAALPPETYGRVFERARELHENPVAPQSGAPAADLAPVGAAHPPG